MLEEFEEKMTTIFLTDAIPARRILLLKRAADKKFAPNLYTGTGGKIEPGEDQYVGAKRELFEETGLSTALTEFGRIVINGKKRILFQFHGIYNSNLIPNCPEGVLEWVPVDKIFELPIIPTAKSFLEEWQKRGWNTDKPFTIYIQREDMNNPFTKVYSSEIIEGLHF